MRAWTQAIAPDSVVPMWTKDIPQTLGFYWWRENPDEPPVVVEITKDGTGGGNIEYVFCGCEVPYRTNDIEGQFWSEPLLPPAANLRATG